MSTDLVAFLKARLDEDEQVAAEVSPSGSLRAAELMVVQDGYGFGAISIDSARVLAEVQAKRAILDAHEDPARPPSRWDGCDDECQWDALRYVLQVLALPYASHPDFDEAWRPAT